MTKEEVDELILENMNLVYKISHKIHSRFKKLIDLDDIIGIASIGLVKAANTFDKDKNCKFSTYAYKVICNQVFMHLRPSLKLECKNIQLLSLSEPMVDGEEIVLLDTITDGFDIEQFIIEKDVVEKLYTFINELDYTLQKIILYKLDNKTQDEIADILGLSQSQISRLLSKAIYQLRLKFSKEGMM